MKNKKYVINTKDLLKVDEVMLPYRDAKIFVDDFTNLVNFYNKICEESKELEGKVGASSVILKLFFSIGMFCELNIEMIIRLVKIIRTCDIKESVDG